MDKNWPKRVVLLGWAADPRQRTNLKAPWCVFRWICVSLIICCLNQTFVWSEWLPATTGSFEDGAQRIWCAEAAGYLADWNLWPSGHAQLGAELVTWTLNGDGWLGFGHWMGTGGFSDNRITFLSMWSLQCVECLLRTDPHGRCKDCGIWATTAKGALGTALIRLVAVCCCCCWCWCWCWCCCLLMLVVIGYLWHVVGRCLGIPAKPCQTGFGAHPGWQHLVVPDQLQPGLAQAGFGQYHVMTFRFSQSWDFTVMPAACHCQDRSLCLSHVHLGFWVAVCCALGWTWVDINLRPSESRSFQSCHRCQKTGGRTSHLSRSSGLHFCHAVLGCMNLLGELTFLSFVFIVIDVTVIDYHNYVYCHLLDTSQ